ncbi:MAG TPA: GntR family transcriptional regulator [Microbacteriaceae bacterium]|nr:GntR family transcriptional regulator [Microbacteriaceae bacterium]
MRILLAPSSAMPLYEQIKDQVRAAVYGGGLNAGDMLPSLRRLAADLRVSIMTVTRAYNDLAAEGLVRNEQGRGFVVRPVDSDRAKKALEERLRAALRDFVGAARAARLTRSEAAGLLDTEWDTP